MRSSGIRCVLSTLTIVAAATAVTAGALAEEVIPDTRTYVVPMYLRPGDLLLCESADLSRHSILCEWDHVAIYVGQNEFVEAVPDHVRRVDLSEFYTWARDITYGYVAGVSDEVRQAAVAFAQSQVDKPYEPDPLKDPNPDSEAWNCSELVWAAYYNQGVDIDVNGWSIPMRVLPNEIAQDNDVVMYAGEAPLTPDRPSGPTTVRRLRTSVYTSQACDPQGERVRYQWDWDEGLQLWDAVGTCSMRGTVRGHIWLRLGPHTVRVRAADIQGNVSSWSAPLYVTVRPRSDGEENPASDTTPVAPSPSGEHFESSDRANRQ